MWFQSRVKVGVGELLACWKFSRSFLQRQEIHTQSLLFSKWLGTARQAKDDKKIEQVGGLDESIAIQVARARGFTRFGAL